MGGLLALAALIVIILVCRSIWKGREARQTFHAAGIAAGELISIDAIYERAELTGILQENIRSARYGLSGRPDRVVRTDQGIVPVEIKSGACPRVGPYEAHLAQLGVYCLLLEEHFQTTVKEGTVQYSDRGVTIPFDDRMRTWVLNVICEVREAKGENAKPRRSHNQRSKCGGCGFRESCPDALD
jgi:CRISPR-associated exonuclease Cas4